ncbi:RNA polymerase sigma factor [Aequorivita viscosa]|uniref:RNA polymerase sigma factor, sigma-70 family n=1 Tax=Aequorivita viscosa TaxID=797419 RepID=A0A1M6KD78_9FLAO|nr:sigma-70 family RNA polymerase sigma factor [Aequorivita viscosa]SDX21099.1 RNA polymerase sigma factor, sigma-70 family [Aequorivita viscosa]SHJ56904.1 RNA polymerase sigma factor, sigma-70 family [Aequorivita viscosa]
MQLDELEEVLLTISYKEDDEKSSLDAFNTIYRAYSKLLSAIVKSNLKKMGIYNQQLYEATINNVFIKLYENPLSFEIPKNAKNDNCFKAWLSVVASNEIKKLIKEYYNKEKLLEVISDEPVIESEDINEELADSVNKKLMIDALNSLSERDKAIMFTLYNYYEEGRKTPTNVLNDLCKLHNTTKLNIRKIKERSEKKIIEFFAQHSQLKPLKNVK